MKQLPVKKNDDIQLTIDNLTGEGSGVGRVDGYAVFVPGALPGELITAHVIKVTSGYAVAKLTEVLTPSPHRVDPPCPYFPACGGCTVQHLSYPEQLKWKRQTVCDALERLAGIKDAEVLETVGMENPLRYRNKGSFPFSADGKAVRFGFFAPRSHRLIPLEDCLIQDERIVDIARRVAEWASAFRVPAYDETSHSGVLRHVMARVSQTGETMAVIVTTGALPHVDALVEMLADVDSVYHNSNPARTNVIFGQEYRLLSGKAELVDRLFGLDFGVSPQSFLQVNAEQVQVLYGEALRMLAPKTGESVADVYCGIGAISLLLAGHAELVTGIESVEQAVADARKNALINGIGNVTFLCAEAESALPQLVAAGQKIDAVVIDPPRKGCDQKVLQAVLDSGAGRMVYVSCNPATLARDLGILTGGGFVIEQVRPVDMFPFTAHVECAALLRRR